MSEERTSEEQKKVIFTFIDLDNNSLPSIDTPREDIPKEILFRNTVILTQEAYDDLVKRADLADGKWVGHWIWDAKSKVYRCSCCNQFPWRVHVSYQDEIFEDLTRTNAYKYCPNCGIKMIEVKE